MVYIRIGEARVLVIFGIIKNVAVSFFLGTTFINKSVKEVFRIEKEISPCNSQPVLILIKHVA